MSNIVTVRWFGMSKKSHQREVVNRVDSKRFFLGMSEPECHEVIGNIHDNQELLKEMVK